MNNIINFERSELSFNINEYSAYLNVSLTDFFEQLRLYFEHKQWNTDLVDILPLAIANTFLIKLIIIRPTSVASSLINHLEVQPSSLSILMPYIIIHLANSHYSGCHVREIACALSFHTAVSASPTLSRTVTYATTSPFQTSSATTPTFASCVCVTHCNILDLLGYRRKTMTGSIHSKINKLLSLLLFA